MEENYNYHRPVMLAECIEGLNINPEGNYVDVTFGGGGHSREILQHLSTGQLFAFDQDPDAKLEAERITDPNFNFIAANFRHLKKYLRVYGIQQVNGILADFGISSHQIDTPERGFSTRFEGNLDMRMNKTAEISAKNIVNEYDLEALHKIFGMYGELKNAKSVAYSIFQNRENGIENINQLKSILKPLAPRGKEHKFFAQVFQALRIEVNEEIKVIEEFLEQTPELLEKKGRLVVMSYHSLEDRPVKNFMRSGKFFGEVEKDFFGNEIKPLQIINRKPIEASADELVINPRARSAKLRIAEKI